MKILIPTDFSSNSEVAVQYATLLAKKLKAELVLFHVVHPPGGGRALLKVRDVEEAMTRIAMNDVSQLVENVKARVKGKVDISWKVIRGYPVEEVVSSYAKNNGIDLVVMGTKGATGLQKIMWGSNATAVINKSEVPVITIPNGSVFNGIKDMVYATDMESARKELKAIIPLARELNARVRVVHISKPPTSGKIDLKKVKEKMKKTTAILRSALKYKKLEFIALHDVDVLSGIAKLADKSNTDMIAMFTHDLSFMEKLRGSGLTREFAFFNKVPLLSFKKSKKS